MEHLLTTIRRGDAWVPTGAHGDIPERKIVQYWLKIENLSSTTYKEFFHVPSFLLAIQIPSTQVGFMSQMVADVYNSPVKPWKAFATPIIRLIH